jgi:hypothetical protein
MPQPTARVHVLSQQSRLGTPFMISQMFACGVELVIGTNRPARIQQAGPLLKSLS